MKVFTGTVLQFYFLQDKGQDRINTQYDRIYT